jgi:hypothetical protein
MKDFPNIVINLLLSKGFQPLRDSLNFHNVYVLKTATFDPDLNLIRKIVAIGKDGSVKGAVRLLDDDDKPAFKPITDVKELMWFLSE